VLRRKKINFQQDRKKTRKTEHVFFYQKMKLPSSKDELPEKAGTCKVSGNWPEPGRTV